MDMPEHLAPPAPMDDLEKAKLARRLPLDEDDYLQPKSSNPNAYLDLKPEDPPGTDHPGLLCYEK